jgi:hypothetical protein
MSHPTAPPGQTRKRGRWALVLLTVLALAVPGIAGLIYWGTRGPTPSPAPEEKKSFPIPPLSKSPYRNARPEVAYVGSETCRSCHRGPFSSFGRTGMGRSMAEVDPAAEPPDSTYDHLPSRRRYEVVRRDERLWHREFLLPRSPGGEANFLAEHPLKYVVGSGRHSRTYLVEADGFLVESPLTWYASRKAWGMSPGYDHPGQGSFERATGQGCLFCHAGRSEALDGSLHRMHIIEPAIACERCHGPGALHVARWAAKEHPQIPRGEVDDTIVNPRDLPRDLKEAICQQCHLRSSATVTGRGRALGSFLPGLPLQDFRQDYHLARDDKPMTVVGHVEQLRMSRCYQASDTLTCLTCHKPHPPARIFGPKPSTPPYKAVCLKCHQQESCTVEPARRARESPQNDCAHCHMPSSPTEIPHLTFTHHRIGIHDKRGKDEHAPTGGPAGALKPFLPLDRLGEVDRERSLGLGYLEAANRDHDPGHATVYRRRALVLLAKVREAGLRDSAVEAALARIHFDLEQPGVAEHAERALADPSLDGQDRCNALLQLADRHVLAGRHREAAELLRKLTRLRRHPADWLLLADCERILGNEAAAYSALESAVRINPRLWKVHRDLADHYRKQGNEEKARWHERRAIP